MNNNSDPDILKLCQYFVDTHISNIANMIVYFGGSWHHTPSVDSDTDFEI